MYSEGELVDIRSIPLKSGLKKEEGALLFFKKIKNPYHFRVDDIEVHVQFSDSNVTTLQTCIEKLLLSSRI